jgi:hypothetical protein
MRKLFVLTLAIALVALCASSAMATKSRLRAMGGIDNYIEDDYNIFNWPATLPSYANILTIELINDEYYYNYYDEYPYTLSFGVEDDAGWYENSVSAMYGLVKGIGEDNKWGALGLFFTEVTWGPNPNHEEFWDDANLFSYPLNNKFTLMYGYAMEGLSFGLFISRADDSEKEEYTDFNGEWHYAYTTIGVGARFDIGDAAYGDVAFDYNVASYKEDPTSYGEITQDANAMYGFKGRVFYQYSDYLTIIPYFGLRMWDFSLKSEDEGLYSGCWGSKGMMIDFGIGTDWMVNDENKIIFAIEPYSYWKLEPSECDEDLSVEGTMTVFPRFLLALESDVTDWLTFRSGCIKELTKYEMKSTEGDEDYTDNYTEAPFCFYMGLGFQVSDFEIDCVLNEEVPFSLGYWLTGYQPDSGDRTPIWMISAKYHF